MSAPRLALALYFLTVLSTDRGLSYPSSCRRAWYRGLRFIAYYCATYWSCPYNQLEGPLYGPAFTASSFSCLSRRGVVRPVAVRLAADPCCGHRWGDRLGDHHLRDAHPHALAQATFGRVHRQRAGHLRRVPVQPGHPQLAA